MCRSKVFIPLLVLCFSGCSTTEEQPQPIPLDHVPSTVPSPSATEVSLLPGYRAEVVVSLLNYPSSITFDPMGNLYVAESGAAPRRRIAPAAHPPHRSRRPDRHHDRQDPSAPSNNFNGTTASFSSGTIRNFPPSITKVSFTM